MNVKNEKIQSEIRKENDKRFKITRLISFGLGIIITEPSSLKDKRRLLAVLITITTLGAIYAHICCAMKHKDDLMTASEAFGVATQASLGLTKMINVAIRQHKYYELVDILLGQKIINEIELLLKGMIDLLHLRKIIRKIISDSWRFARLQLLAFLIASICIMSSYMFTALTINTYNIAIGSANFTIVHAFPAYFTAWESTGKATHFPYFPIIMFVEAMSIYVSGMGSYLYNSLFIILISHGIAMMRILNAMIELSTTEHVPKKYRVRYLMICCYFHKRILGYCQNINRLYSIVTLIQFFQSSLILAIVLFRLNTALGKEHVIFMTMIFYALVSSLELLTHCFNGQCLTNESESLALSWYCNCEWYEESVQFRKIIYMMIMRSRSDIIMVAAYFAAMNLQTFQSIMNSSGSYFLMLRNFKGD